jgi:hypothetical protein
MNPYRKLLISAINELLEWRLISLAKENIGASDETAIDCIRRRIDGGLFCTMSHQQGEQ